MQSPDPFGGDACFTKPEPMDLVLGSGRKVLGGALRRRKNRILYQGSLQLPKSLGKDSSIEDAVARGLSLEWGVSFKPEELAGPQKTEADRLAGSRYRSEAWSKKR